MIKVNSLVDDANVDGAMRELTTTVRCFAADIAAVLMSIRAAWRLPLQLQGEIIIMDLTMSWAKLLFLIALRLTSRGRPIVVEHTYTTADEASQVAHSGRFRRMLQLAFGLADKVVPVSEGQAAWLHVTRPVRPGKFMAIIHALDGATLGDVPEMPAPTWPMGLGASCRYTRQKGCDALIEAMRLMPRNIAALAFAGYGRNEAMLHKAALDLEHATFHGKLAEPKCFLSRDEVLVVPSRWEAYGLVGIEARAAGRPIIASAADGLIEQMRKSWGLLAPHADPTALAAGILRLATPDRVKMGNAARGSTAGRFADKTAAWQNLLGAFAPNADLGSAAVAP